MYIDMQAYSDIFKEFICCTLVHHRENVYLMQFKFKYLKMYLYLTIFIPLY